MPCEKCNLEERNFGFYQRALFCAHVFYDYITPFFKIWGPFFVCGYTEMLWEWSKGTIIAKENVKIQNNDNKLNTKWEVGRTYRKVLLVTKDPRLKDT